MSIAVILALLSTSLLALILDYAVIKIRSVDHSTEQQNQDELSLKCVREELRYTCRSKCA